MLTPCRRVHVRKWAANEMEKIQKQIRLKFFLIFIFIDFLLDLLHVDTRHSPIDIRHEQIKNTLQPFISSDSVDWIEFLIIFIFSDIDRCEINSENSP